jgi:hypothetical protein
LGVSTGRRAGIGADGNAAKVASARGSIKPQCTMQMNMSSNVQLRSSAIAVSAIAAIAMALEYRRGRP